MTDNERKLQSYKSMRSIYDRKSWDRNSIDAAFFNGIRMDFLDKEIERLQQTVLEEKIIESLENTNISVYFDNQKITDAIIKELTGNGGGK